ncbi:uncharacterized protein [Littorina saxatilis]|uniref:uncharacterized protein n=1 Tax=Littorina saxatilis TaxID=31220 RepID=UPI0038B693E6
MHSVTLSSACLLFVAMAGVDVQSAGQMITCDAGTFKVGKPAYITCHFRTNVNDTKRSINMARYPPDAPGTIGTDVVLCPWSEEKKKHDCFTEMDNYELVGDITDRLTVKIPEVSVEHADLYMCFFVPPDQTDPHPCELHVQEGPDISSSGEKQSVLLIILPCVLVIVAIASFGTFCLLRRRSRRCRCTTESETWESTQAMIPLEEHKVSITA